MAGRVKTVPKLIISKEPDVKALQASLEEHILQVYQDISRGSSRHVISADAPAAGDIENGELRLQDGVAKRLYTKMGGALYYVTLTAV